MSDFKERLIEEQAQLEEELTKLNEFNQSGKADTLDSNQKSLLLIQAGIMYSYNKVLKARLLKL